MSKALEFGKQCIAKDTSICRDALSRDGEGILCEKHIRRICIGETVALTKEAQPEHDAALERLHKRFHGKGAKFVQKRAAAQGAGETPQKPKEKFELNLVSLSVISAGVTVYSALIVLLQAWAFGLPLGMALSGFNATTIAIQSVPHTVLFLLALAVIALGTLLLVTWFTQVATFLISIPILIFVLLTWPGVQMLRFCILSLLGVARLFGGQELRLLTTAQGWLNWLGDDPHKKVLLVTEKVRGGFLMFRNYLAAPFRMIFLGIGDERTVIWVRSAAFVFLLLSAMALAVLNAQDRDRRMERIASECGTYATKSECSGVSEHAILDPVDRYLAKLNPYTIEWPEVDSNPLRWQYADAWRWTSNVGQHAMKAARNVLSFEPAVGTFAYAAPNGTLPASHIMGDPETITEKSFRTEPLFHVGDFGEWALVARKEDVSQRVLLRRSAIAEFSEQSEVLNPGQKTLKTQVLAEATQFVGALNTRLLTSNAALRVANAELKRLRDEKPAASGDGTTNVSHTTSVSVVPVLQTFVQEGGGSGPDLPPVLEAGARGIATRSLGVYDDMVRTYGSGVIELCRDEGERLPEILFADGVTRWEAGQAPEAFSEAVEVLKARLAARQDDEVELVLVQGRASYTGTPEVNLRVSEQRAEWVKAQLLRALLQDDGLDTATMGTKAQALHRVNLVAYGLGEVQETAGNAGRAVEVRICTQPEMVDPEGSAELASTEMMPGAGETPVRDQ
ncbi:MAG: hypothetical protein AAFR73_11580 [Pseudomonadota bacterium]